MMTRLSRPLAARTVSLSTVVSLLFFMFGAWGCGPEATAPMAPPPGPTENPSMGALHNEFLSLLHTLESDPTRGKAGALATDPVVEAAQTMALRYGIAPMSPAEIHAAVEKGRRMAQQDPDTLIRSILSPEEVRWWSRFASEATPRTARSVYAEHCRRYGKPENGSMLATFADVAMASAEYWSVRRADAVPVDEPLYVTAYAKGWRDSFRRLGRLAVAVTVDGVSGTLAANGGAGPIGGLIVGGLASHGADCAIFGCD